MLGSIRKFSKTFMAKIFIAIIALPFILWGMGDIFSSGKQNIIAEINDETISSKEFIGYIQKIELSQKEIESSIKFQRKCLMAVVTGAELLNNKFDFFNSINIGGNSITKDISKILQWHQLILI